MTAALPEVVASSGATSEEVLDVRDILDKGGDPFHLIVRTVQKLRDDQALRIVVGFEPQPLYAVMKTFGREAHTEQHGELFHVWFYRTGPSPDAPREGASEPVPLKPPVELDVRGLEPPAPMMAVLEKLVELGPGAQLVIHHHREPVLLYEKLALRGYGARTEKRGEGDYLVHVAPAWTFEA